MGRRISAVAAAAAIAVVLVVVVLTYWRLAETGVLSNEEMRRHHQQEVLKARFGNRPGASFRVGPGREGRDGR